MSRGRTRRGTRAPWWALAALVCALGVASVPARAGVPLSLFRSYAGNIQFTGTAGTLRAQSDSGNPCAVNPSGANGLSGLPAGSTVVSAILYWAGSGSTVDPVVTFQTPVTTVGVTANRTFTERFTIGGTNYDFFSGAADVTALVSAGGNGTYRLSNLTVSTGNPWCSSSAVLSGWSLVVVYSHPSEPNRVINLHDGFEYFYGSALTIVADNFQTPASAVDGRVGHITWEGDTGNSGSLGGFSERLTFEGNVLSGPFNPNNNQFNSTINFLSDTTRWGVDFDYYDVSAYLSPGQTSASTQYSSGGDLVLLSVEILSVTNVPTADLAIQKSHSGSFLTGQPSIWDVDVFNNGPAVATGPITVIDTLPAGIAYSSFSGAGWSCAPAGQTVTCSHGGPLAASAGLPTLRLEVVASPVAVPGVTNTASVDGPEFDHISANDSAADATTVVHTPDLLVLKSVSVLDDPVNGTSNPKAIPGANLVYSIEISNEGLGTVDSDELHIEDPLPAELELYVADFGAGPGPIDFLDGTPTSGLTLTFTNLSDPNDDVAFDDGSDTWLYSPTPDAEGYDAAVRAIRVTPSGTMNPSSGTPPSFEIRFRARLQ